MNTANSSDQNHEPLTALEIAQYFVYLSNKEEKVITNKKLQKLVYYAQAWSLVLTDKKLFEDPVEAWVHGPAIRSLYIKYKMFGYGPIQQDIDADQIQLIDGEVKELLDDVWKVYGKLDAGYLEMLTHSEEPWLNAREGLQDTESSSNEIMPETMKAFYSKRLQDASK